MGIATLRLVAFLLACTLSFAAEKQLRFAIRTDPKTFDPLLASEEASEAVRFLTGGVLIRLNRKTQQLQPELAESWQVDRTGKTIEFRLRRGLVFSDGSPFDAADVAATIARLNNKTLRSGIAETFRSGGTGEIRTAVKGSDIISVTFPAPLAGVAALFDQLAISSSRSRTPERAVAGPFVVAEHKSGQYVLLRRNPRYWKTDSSGHKLPYADAVRLDIQASRDVELLRFRRGELHLVDKLEPETFDRLSKDMPGATVDVGPSLDSEVLWFNLRPDAPIAPQVKAWFQSLNFRKAVSGSVHRDDIVRLVYRGHASPAAGHISSSNKQWSDGQLKPHSLPQAEATKLLAADGFSLKDGRLTDRAGNPVEFTIVTNAGSKPRAQIAAIIQDDLKRIGIKVNIVPLEFGSLLERITQSGSYDVCLLGFANVEVDPNSQVNVFLSSGNLHAWNPAQKTPATKWEAEIDRLIQQQSSAPPEARKRAFSRVQQILRDEMPIVYIVHPNVLVAASRSLKNAAPSVLPPHLHWNAEFLDVTQ